jgi:hypothetical protein
VLRVNLFSVSLVLNAVFEDLRNCLLNCDFYEGFGLAFLMAILCPGVWYLACRCVTPLTVPLILTYAKGVYIYREVKRF